MTRNSQQKTEPQPPDDSFSVCESQTDYMSHDDFSNKTRGGVPFGGLPPTELTEEALKKINTRWETFYREKKDIIDRLADYDEDLASIGMLSVRGTLARYPHCPDSWLVQRAKYDILSARKWGASVDYGWRNRQRDDIGDIVGNAIDGYDQRLGNYLSDAQQKRIIEHAGATNNPEREVIDQISYYNFMNKLDRQEKQLVEILIDEHRDKPKWYDGRYISKSTKPAPKTRFKQEVSDSEHDYRVSYANVRYWFYEIFGTLKEAKREKEWYDHFSPRKGSLHASRDGRYQQTRVYAEKNEIKK